MRKGTILISTTIAGIIALSGCSKFSEQFKDSPKLDVRNSTPAEIIEMPDGFNNWATKCDNGNRIYGSFHSDGAYAAIAVVPHDPTCLR